MLTIHGLKVRHCDGITRRSFLKAGSLGIGGLTFADLLRAEATAAIGSSSKAVINIHLDGGPPQMDMIDLKPQAPREVRGEFKSIRTKIPGFHVCELMPKVASIADKFVFIRSMVGAASAHNAFQCLSGFDAKALRSIGGRPAMGCVLTKLLGSPADPAPSFVDLMQGRPFVRNSVRPGFLGPAYKAFRPDISKMFSRTLEDKMKLELAARGANHSIRLSLIDGLSAENLQDRVKLLSRLDRIRRDLDASGVMDAMDQYTQQAVGILTSGRFAQAMDLSRENRRTLERYTPKIDETGERFYTSEGPMAARKLLLARRLVEAGVRCVSVSISDFDTHSSNFPRMRQLLPIVDHALHALITDLDERNMLADVSIVVWGEFGRTPRINAKGGRDHWPKVGMAMLAGGGMKVGQVLGETDRFASEAVERPVHYQDVIATLYHNFGIDPRATTVIDTSGRPQYLVDIGKPIRELV